MVIIKNLVKLRKELNMSQAELAEKLGVSQQTISKYERGTREPDNKTLIKLSEIFNCTTDYLLGRTNIQNPYIPEEYSDKYKVNKHDMTQYEDFITQAGIFFMNDEIAEEDKEKLFRDISELFWKAKEMNKEKYGKKKNTKSE